MSYCKEFFHKYEKDGNFCGLDRSQESRINGYLGIVKLLEKQNIPEDDIYKNLTVKACEPLIAAKDDARTKGLNYVTSRLKDGEKITAGDLQATFKAWGFTSKKSGDNGHKKEIVKEEPAPESCINATTEAPPSPIAQTLKERYSITETPIVQIQKEEFLALPPLSKDAPMSEVLKRDALRLAAFTTADQYDPMTGGKFVKREPYKISKALLIDGERDRCIDDLLERTSFTPKDIDIFDDIVKAGGYGCRFALFEDMVRKLEAP